MTRATIARQRRQEPRSGGAVRVRSGEGGGRARRPEVTRGSRAAGGGPRSGSERRDSGFWLARLSSPAPRRWRRRAPAGDRQEGRARRDRVERTARREVCANGEGARSPAVSPIPRRRVHHPLDRQRGLEWALPSWCGRATASTGTICATLLREGRCHERIRLASEESEACRAPSELPGCSSPPEAPASRPGDPRGSF
jgi:hypothetical protein